MDGMGYVWYAKSWSDHIGIPTGFHLELGDATSRSESLTIQRQSIPLDPKTMKNEGLKPPIHWL